MKKIWIAVGLFLASGVGVAQTLPTLPAVNVLSAGGITCTFTVVDAQMGLATECLDSAGFLISRAANIATTKGSLTGAGPILCLYGIDNATPPNVRLQCMTDDDPEVAPRIVLDGKLAPVAKKRQWWIFWR